MTRTKLAVWMCLALAGGTGCVGSDQGETDAGSSACPGDLSRTTNANLIFYELRLDGLDYFVGFDPDASYAEGDAACIDEAGTHMRLIFEAAGAPFGSFELHVETAGAFALSESSGVIAFYLFGVSEPAAFDQGVDWQSGTADVPSIVAPLAVDLAGTASAHGHNLSVTLSADGTPGGG